MPDLHAQLAASTKFIRERAPAKPVVGIVLGSGLGPLSDSLSNPTVVEGSEIPFYPRASAPGHRGKLRFGELAGVPVVLMDGRLHRYEGHEFDSIVYPVRLMMQLGIELLVVSNAAGGVNPDYATGDVVVLDDHINMMWGNPLTGPNDDRMGPRFPDMSCPYDPDISDRAVDAARAENLNVHRGVYLAFAGPTYETPAEYSMARKLGADVVGMSTVPEVITASHAGMRVLGLSVVSNVVTIGDDDLEGTSGDDVLSTVGAVAPAVGRAVETLIAEEFSS